MSWRRTSTAFPPHEGRGGWSWYTGAAGWYYRLMVESLLGVSIQGDRMFLRPLLPPDWPEVTMTCQIRGERYSITVTGETEGSRSITVNGFPVTEDWVALPRTGAK